MRMNFKGLAFGLGLLGAVAQAKVQVTLVPAIQFVRQGSSVLLKARVRGHRHDPGLAWSIVAPGPGSLAHADLGRVRYVADGVEPWSRVQVRVTSLEDPARHADAVIEVLPSEAFGVLEQVLGPGWIEAGAERPALVRLEIKEPRWFSWSGSYTFSAEVDSFERDRFAWAVHPGIGRLSRVATGDRSRDTVRFDPPAGEHPEVLVRVTARNLDNPAYIAEGLLELPPQNTAVLHPVDLGFGTLFLR
jgi:hypothetical protein